MRPGSYAKLDNPTSIRDMGTYRVVRVRGGVAHLAESHVWNDDQVVREEPVDALKAVEPTYRDLLGYTYYNSAQSILYRVQKGAEVEGALRRSVSLRGVPREVKDTIREMVDDALRGRKVAAGPQPPSHRESKLLSQTADRALWKTKSGSRWVWIIAHHDGAIDHDAPLVGGYAGNYLKARDAVLAWSQMGGDRPARRAFSEYRDPYLFDAVDFLQHLRRRPGVPTPKVRGKSPEILLTWPQWDLYVTMNVGPNLIIVDVWWEMGGKREVASSRHFSSTIGYRELAAMVDWTLQEAKAMRPHAEAQRQNLQRRFERLFRPSRVASRYLEQVDPGRRGGIHPVAGLWEAEMLRTADEAHARSIALMKFLSKVTRRLGVAEHVYVVGGAVRNFLIDRPIKDIDVVVDSVSLGGRKDSDWVARRIEQAIPASVNLTTNQYGVAILTVKGSWMLDGVEMRGEVIEIANARKESYGGAGGKGYKPHQVEPATIEEDVVRREFTFNTLMWRLLDVASGPDKAEIIDLTGCGRRDLENREMRCPADPDKVFADDPTRLMRAIKFVAKYGFKIPPDLASAIKRNAPKMKQAPWEAIGTLLVENVLKESTAREALKLMDSLGLLKVVAEMVKGSKPFQSYLAGQLRDQKVQVLLDLMDLGVDVRSPVSFLTREQQHRLREVTVGMPEGEAERFLAVLKKVPLDNMALITKFDIPKHERGTLAATARELMLENPDLASNPSALQRTVERELSRMFRTAQRRLAAPKKYDHIDFKPPESVANAAEKGLEYRQKASPSNRGGLTTEEAGAQGIGSGVQRAVNLKNRNAVTPETIGKMVGFFSRHEKNKGVKPENKGKPWNDKGHVAWLLWGGDPGKTWAEKVKGQMEAADEKEKTAMATRKADSDGSYMSVQHLRELQEHAGDLLNTIDSDTALEDWVESKITESAASLRAVYEFMTHGRGKESAMPLDNGLTERIAARFLDKTARRFRVWQNSTEGVHNLAAAIAKGLRREEGVEKVRLGRATDYNREVHFWMDSYYDPYDRKRLMQQAVDAVGRKLRLRKGQDYGHFGDGISVIEDTSLNAPANKFTLLVKVQIEDGTEEEYEAALAKGYGKRAAAEGTTTGDGSSVGLFIPLPAELAAQFPSLGDEDSSPSHVTLLYVGPIDADQEDLFLDTVAKTLASEPGPIRAWLDGVDKFVHPAHGRELFYSPVRFSRDVGTIRDRLTSALHDAGFEVLNRYPLAYCPHTTLAYVDGLDHVYFGEPPTGAWEFSTVQVWGLPEDHELSLGSFVQHDMTLRERQEAGLLSAWGDLLEEG